VRYPERLLRLRIVEAHGGRTQTQPAQSRARRARLIGRPFEIGVVAALIDSAAHVGPQLRGVAEPKFYLPDDAYVAPCEDAAKVAARLKELGLA